MGGAETGGARLAPNGVRAMGSPQQQEESTAIDLRNVLSEIWCPFASFYLSVRLCEIVTARAATNGLHEGQKCPNPLSRSRGADLHGNSLNRPRFAFPVHAPQRDQPLPARAHGPELARSSEAAELLPAPGAAEHPCLRGRGRSRRARWESPCLPCAAGENTRPLPVLSDCLPRCLVSTFGISVGKPLPVAPQKERLQAQAWWEPGQGHLEQTPKRDKFPWKAAHLYIKRMQIV